MHLGSYGPLFRARHRALTSWRLHCPVGGANGLQEDCRSAHEASFVADVTVDEVLAEALDLLATEPPMHPPDDLAGPSGRLARVTT